ncbi:hypothetical protein GF402_04270 [Candidatus Fermentibacteria bacterium]|nr:hypothetical protein [Candidatus Fermentibacteria bacterium]
MVLVLGMMAGIAFLVRSLPGFVLFMVLLSTGQNMFFPLRDAMAMELSDGKRRGTVLGIVGASRCRSAWCPAPRSHGYAWSSCPGDTASRTLRQAFCALLPRWSASFCLP